MKIILSRKGFDSSTEEGFSPLLEVGLMISYPIPEPDKNAKINSCTELADIKGGGKNFPEDLSKNNYYMEQLMQSF